MTTASEHNVVSRWVRAGVLFSVKPASQSPDLERLLLDTARLCAGNSRLFILAATWLVEYGSYIARHRLKHLILNELSHDTQPVLGLLVDCAVAAGAYRELRTVTKSCKPADEARPLFEVDRVNQVYTGWVQQNASPQSKRWNLWIQPIDLKPDALRPATWIFAQNPEYRDRALRKGDLRCSILESLKRDTADGFVASESELARLCSANRTAVRRALNDLAVEGIDLRDTDPLDRRSTPLRIKPAA